MDLNIFKTDEQKSDEGVWCPVDVKTDIKIGRYGNRTFQRALKREMQPYKRLIDRDALDDETADKVLVNAIAEGLLLDWRGMTRDGEPLPYSREAAIEILSNKQFRDFRQLVVELAQDMQLFREEEVEQNEGKSQSLSDGNLSGENEKTSSAA
jgi:hypothetical protein